MTEKNIPDRDGNKFSSFIEKTKSLYRKAAYWAFDNPAKMSALITIPGDAAMLISGIIMQNWGRIAAGVVGVISQLPIVLHGDKEVAHDSTIEDPQDNKSHWLKKIYQAIRNPQKYPFEFYSYLNLLQAGLMATLSGPAWNVAGIEESSRPGESASGFMGTAAFGIMLLREDAEDYEDEPKSKVKKGFLSRAWDKAQTPIKDVNGTLNFCTRYLKQGATLGIRDSFNNASDEISKRGPNQIAAKIIDYGLIPYGIEAILVRDYASVLATGIYYVSNIFLKESSKRIYRATPPTTLASISNTP